MEQDDIVLSTTLAQKQLFALAQMNEEGQLAYNEAYALELKGPLDRVAMRKALQGVVDRRDCLRITIVPSGEQQIIHASSKVNARYISTEGFSEGVNSETVKKWIDDELSIKFDLVNGPLYRFCLAKINENQHLLLMVYHHIIIDGWSVSICLKDVAELYSAEVEMREASLEPAISYADYVFWLSENIDKEKMKSCKKYWLEKYVGDIELLNFPKKLGAVAKRTFLGGVVKNRIDIDFIKSLNHFAERKNSSIMMVLYAIYTAFVGRICRQNEFIVGVPTLGRNFNDSEYISGYCTTVLPVINKVEAECSFSSYLECAEKELLDLYEYQSYPYAHILEDIVYSKNIEKSKFVQTTINYISYIDTYSFANLEVNTIFIDKKYTAFDLELNILKEQNKCFFNFKYSEDIFDKDGIESLCNSFFVFMKGIISDPDRKIGGYDLLTESERNKIVNEWNNTTIEYDKEKCIHTLFEMQVEKEPSSVALECNKESISYKELNQRANQLAHYLAGQGVGHESLVGICIDRSIEQVVAIIGVLKAGGAYVPIDPTYPKSRISYMVEDAHLDKLITVSSVIECLSEINCKIINLADENIKENIKSYSARNLDIDAHRCNAKSLAYVIYTSGSTGRPKGVAVTHKSLVNLGNNINRILMDTYINKIIWAWNASFSFDASLQAISQLAYGATVVLVPEEVRRDPALIFELFKTHSVNVFDCTPLQLNTILERNNNPKMPIIFVGGDKVGEKIWNNIITLSETSNVVAYNVYGPTEACVDATICKISKDNPFECLGNLLNNVVGYIINYDSLSPIGIPGELLLGGDGIAKGYLNKPELTAEKFVSNTFIGQPEEKLYKTGDICRWLPNGKLEYIGRADFQVKIRGYRVELGEIEYCIANQENISDCAVIVNEDDSDDKFIVAYVVLKNKIDKGDDGHINYIREYLEEKLPDYMVPSFFIAMDNLPVTPSGKLDRKALPKPKKRPVKNNLYTAPRTIQEKKICEIWQQILKVKPVGIDDNFMKLGGHSLKALQVVSRLREEFSIEIPVRLIFDNPAVRELSVAIEGHTGEKSKVITSICRSDKQIAQASFAQQRMWFINQLEEQKSIYNIPFVFSIEGKLCVRALKRSLINLIERHDVLRTIFREKNGEIIQHVLPSMEFNIEEVDFCNLPMEKQNRKMQDAIREEAKKPFNLAKGPMLRAKLAKCSPERFTILITIHHIAFDGWSASVFFSEISTLYSVYREEKENPLSELPIRYIDFSMWQRDWLQGKILEQQYQYWKDNLRGIPETHSLSLDHPRPPSQSYSGASYYCQISKKTTSDLKSLANRTGASLFMVLQAALAILISRYSNETDVVIGFPIANRVKKEVEPLIGVFVNTLVLRSDLSENPNFYDFLNKTKEKTLMAYAHQHIPFELLVDKLELERNLSYSPIFQVMLVLQDQDMNKLSLSDLRVSQQKSDYKYSKFDLTLDIIEQSGSLVIRWEYADDIFERESIRRMAVSFDILLKGISTKSNEKISALPIISEEERYKLLVEWNQTTVNYLEDKTIYELFEEQVEHRPAAIALTFEGESLSYQQLNERANQLAYYLLEMGVKPDTLVGICVDRSPEMVVGLLGILKAGGAYVPMDPHYPAPRLQYMLEDSGTNILLTQSHLKDRLSIQNQQVVCLDRAANLLEYYSITNVSADASNSDLEHLAYVIYTSGSTGQPKGVMCTQKGILNRLLWMQETYNLSSHDTVLQKTPFSFDVSVWEFFWPLMVGARLVVAKPEGHKDPTYLSQLIARESITTLHFVPSMLSIFVDSVRSISLPSMRQVFCSGEELPMRLQNRFFEAFETTELHNLYGPTEAAIDVSYWACQKADKRQSVPIGAPIANTKLFVLDSHLQPVPIGVPGELLIGGVNLARGYLNKRELTEEKFISHPFSQDKTERLYKTGDLARWLPDGNLEYLGRIDNQVKVRGFRIELGEIESRLSEHEGVADCVVVAREDQANEKRLVAYITASNQAAVTNLIVQKTFINELRVFIGRQLPEYMVPSAMMVLEAIPLSPNGKVDRKALPAPDLSQSQAIYVPPTTGIEQLLCQVWQGVLGLERVGVTDNFYSLGGDSIQSIQVASRAKQQGVSFSVRQMFEHQCIRDLVKHANAGSTVIAPQEFIQGAQTLLPIHQQFFNRQSVDRHYFNQSFLLVVPDDFTAIQLEAVVSSLYHRHDALRLRYANVEGQWQAVYRSFEPAMVKSTLGYVDFSELPTGEHVQALAEHGEAIQSSLSLSEGPLWRAVLFTGVVDGVGTQQGNRLLLALHHLVVDGLSWRILLKDIETGYSQLQAGDTIVLAPKSSSCQQWGNFLATYAACDVLWKERDYWLNQLKQPVPPLPIDHAEARGNTHATTDTVMIALAANETEALLQTCHKAYRTQINELLLSGLLLGVGRWVGKPCLRLDLEGHGREDLSDAIDLSETIGWFTSIFPLVLQAEASSPIAEVIKAIKEQVRSIPAKGIGYGVLRYLARDEELCLLSEGSVPPIVFNYLGQLDQILGEKNTFRKAKGFAGHSVSLCLQREHSLAFNGWVNEGRLQFKLDYNRLQYKRDTMEQLCCWIEEGLRAVIDHCLSEGVGGYTPSDFPLAELTQTQLDQWQREYPDLSNLYASTPMQQGLLFHSLLEEGHGAYVTQIAMVLVGKLNLEFYRSAWQKVVDRYDVFRTAFVGLEKVAQQLVVTQAKLSCQYFDWRKMSTEELEFRLFDYQLKDKKNGFHFSDIPLMRLTIFRLSDQRYQVLWTYHHALIDGWSLPIILGEVGSIYRAKVQGKSLDLAPATAYCHYVEWLQKQDQAAARAYWKEALELIEAPTSLSVDTLPVEDDASGQQETVYALSRDHTSELIKLAQQACVTLNTLVQGAWAYLLHRYSGEEHVVFGATVSGRTGALESIERMVGLFINTIPVTVTFREEQTLIPWLQQIQAESVKREAHGYLSLAEIQDLCRVPNGINLFNSLMVFENYPIENVAVIGEKNSNSFTLEQITGHEETNYALTLLVFPNEQLTFKLKYQTKKFSTDTMMRLLGHLESIIIGMLNAEIQHVKDLPLLKEIEKKQLFEWNDTKVEHSIEKCIHELFEDQVYQHPDALALSFEENSMSYWELNQRANQIAYYLVSQGIKSDTLVGICVDRSLEMIVGILAILKAGGAYVPLDPCYPDSRIQFILEDSAINVLLTQDHIKERFSSHNQCIVILDNGNEAFRDYSVENIPRRKCGLKPNSLAYVIYTSGTTGKPKGVLIEHKNVVRLMEKNVHSMDFGRSDTWLMFHSYVFDFSVWEIWGALAFGGKLIIATDEMRKSPDCLYENIISKYITILNQTPFAFYGLAKSVCSNPKELPLRYIIFGGEKLDYGKLSDWYKNYEDDSPQLVNMYGITETTVHVTKYFLKSNDVDFGVNNVGIPLDDLSVYICNGELELQPIGVPGELLVGGYGLARGYLNRSELTSEKFIKNPFSGGELDRLYRSGDLARRLPNGDLEYIGRMDNQVKIRGFRIELGEIEKNISLINKVNECVAMVREDSHGDRRIVAYIVFSKNSNEAELADKGIIEIRGALSGKLPDYMMPSAFVIMNKFPLTINGKVDRKKLPIPGDEDLIKKTYVAPAGEVESTLASIWSKVLGVKKVGMSDNFFDIGGNSLKVIEVKGAIDRDLKFNISIIDLFSHPTILSLIGFIQNQEEYAPDRKENIKKGKSTLKNIRNRRNTTKA